MATHSEIVQDMLTALALSEPDLDTGIGSIIRKMLDAVAEPIAERDGDSYLVTYAYDIDSKSGADLDEMVRLFGFSRLPVQRATGSITFSRSTASTVPVSVPAGTQVVSTNAVAAITLLNTVMSIGDLAISVPASALNGGADGNVPANTLTGPLVPGFTNITNPVAFTGGTDAEDDEHLRKRFKATIFRNMAGTEQMFLGIALNDPSVSQASVVGASKRFRERLELIAGTATSTVQDAVLILGATVVAGPNITGGSILKRDVHYTFNDSVIPPTLTAIPSGGTSTAMPDGIYDIDFEYVPISSRNLPASGITNRVDVYIKGTRATNASDTLIFRTARVFNTTPTDPLYRLNFRRLDETAPVNGNYFIPYSFTPVIDASTSDQIIINGVTYLEGTHYWLVYDKTAFGKAPHSLGGIEFHPAPLAVPPDLKVFTVAYPYNKVPADLEAAINNWRMVGTDVWVHEGKLIRLRLYLAVILTPGLNQSTVQAALEAALGTFIDSIGFRNTVQASDLLQVAHSVTGVDAVRFLTNQDDPTNYAIQRVTAAGTVTGTYSSTVTPKRATDVLCGDDETPVLDAVIIDVRAENSWGQI